MLYLADASKPADNLDQQLTDALKSRRGQEEVLLVYNKTDSVDSVNLQKNKASYQNLLAEAKTIEISAKSGKGLEKLLALIEERLPEGPEYYPVDQITEILESDIAAIDHNAAMARTRTAIQHCYPGR